MLHKSGVDLQAIVWLVVIPYKPQRTAMKEMLQAARPLVDKLKYGGRRIESSGKGKSERQGEEA